MDTKMGKHGAGDPEGPSVKKAKLGDQERELAAHVLFANDPPGVDLCDRLQTVFEREVVELKPNQMMCNSQFEGRDLFSKYENYIFENEDFETRRRMCVVTLEGQERGITFTSDVAGMMRVNRQLRHTPQGKEPKVFVYLNDGTHVLKNYRRRGYAKKMFQFFITQLNKLDGHVFWLVKLDSPFTLQGCLEKLGFKKCELLNDKSPLNIFKGISKDDWIQKNNNKVFVWVNKKELMASILDDSDVIDVINHTSKRDESESENSESENSESEIPNSENGVKLLSSNRG